MLKIHEYDNKWKYWIMIDKINRRYNMRIWMLNVLNRMRRNEFECWNNGIAQLHHHSSLNWMTVLQTCCIFFANLNDTNLDLIRVNANLNAGKMKSNDGLVVHDLNLRNWMIIKWIWSTKVRNWLGKPIYFSSLHNFVMFKDICKWDLLLLSMIFVSAVAYWGTTCPPP